MTRLRRLVPPKIRGAWIIACDGSNPQYPYGFACLRCNEKKSLPGTVPMAFSVYLKAAKEFQRKHAKCAG
jgi:transcription elongation factor Elf1